MRPAEAAGLVARILAAMGRDPLGAEWLLPADRERVASDLAGVEQHREDPDKGGDCQDCAMYVWPCPDANRYAAGLIRTAALYGVTP